MHLPSALNGPKHARGNALERFEPNSVLLISTLLSGEVFGFAAKLLARGCHQSEYVLTKITRVAVENPDRNGGIHKTQRKPYCGHGRTIHRFQAA
jgi:hypothetical protein